MRIIYYILQKEFIQIFRNKALLPLIFVAPIAQMTLLSYAASFEVKHIRLGVIDQDMSAASRRLTGKISASETFILNYFSTTDRSYLSHIETDQVDLILVIPASFEKNLTKENAGSLQLIVNGVNSQKAALALAYSNIIIQDFNRELIEESGAAASQLVGTARFDVQYANWFNPRLDYTTFMVPGILAELATLVVIFLSAINIVREKEVGTIEQLNVTPIRKYQFIIGKLTPFWVIGMLILCVGLTFGKLWFNIPILGNLGVLFLFAAVYLCAVLGIGLFISTMSETQRQAILTTWFFSINFILLCGLFTATENMPQWVHYINVINPLFYFVEVNRLILLKGGGFREIAHPFYAMGVYAIVINSLAVWRYRKTA